MKDETVSQAFAFGPFVLFPARQKLLHNDVAVRIGGRALDILTVLVEHAGELVSKRELMAAVWPDTIVDESNLKVNIAALRRVLGDGGPDDARYIATVTGRGYKLIAPVRPAVSAVMAPAPAASGARWHNLPTGTTRVIGRADVIDAIRRDFEISRLVTVVGPGGIGKTTVALAVAEHAVESFRDGVWLIGLALTRDPQQIPSTIATSIGIGIAGNAANMTDVLCASLQDRNMLLVVDSCEHLIDASAECVGRILSAAAGVKILVTSREPLELNGERVRRLPGLGTPPTSEHLSAAEAMSFPAIQLFVDRAMDRLDSFRLADADAPAVAEICRRLDGLALAIELAAARIEAFGVAGLLKQLDNRFRLLVGRRSGPERHRTLTATLAWSYSLLTDEEASLLCAVSVFADVFGIDDAAAVAALPVPETADMLAQLSAKSLLMSDLDSDGIAYRMLETTHTYCLDKLRLGADEQRIRQRHAEHTYAILEAAGKEWARRPAHEWEASYRRVLGDLRAALQWSGQDPQNASLTIRLTVAGLLLWNHFSLTEECLRHVSHAVGELDAAGLAETAFEMKLKLWLGCSTMFTRGLKLRAMEALQRALQIAILIGDVDHRLRCLMMIAIYELFTGEHRKGERTLGDFAAVAGAEDPSALPEGEVHVGIAELFLGELRSSRQRLENLERRDLRYFGSYAVRYLSDPIVLVRSVLTQAQWLTGSPDTAMRTAALAVDDARRTRHHLSLNNILSYACPVFFWSGQYDECRRYLDMLDESVTRHGLSTRRPVASFYRAALRHALDGSSADGVAALEQAVEEFRSINHLARMPYYLAVLAEALADAGRIGEAETTIRNAREIAHTQEEAWCVPEVLRIQASIALRRGDGGQAEDLLMRAMGMAQSSGALSWRLRAATDLARLWHGRGAPATGHRLLLPVMREFTEGFATRDVATAGLLIDELAPPLSKVHTCRRSE